MGFLLFSLKINGFQFEQPTKFMGLWNPAQQTTTSRQYDPLAFRKKIKKRKVNKKAYVNIGLESFS